jgi:hypothetical protein
MSYPLQFIGIEFMDIEKILGPQGYDCMVAYLSETNPGVLPLYTPGYFRKWQELARAYRRTLETLPSQRETVVGTPSAAGIQYLLQERGCSAVITPVLTYEERFSHLTVAYEATEAGTIKVYSPELPSEEIFIELSLSDIDEDIAQSEPLLGGGRSFVAISQARTVNACFNEMI